MVTDMADSSIYESLRAVVSAEEPVVLATLIDGPGRGAKLLVRPTGPVEGTMGNDDLDRVVTRDARGELAAGRSGVRHSGEHGEAREGVVSVFL